MRKMLYKIHLEPESDDGFTVTAPALPGCITWGKDYEHAVNMAHEAIAGYLEVLQEQGKPLPEETFSAAMDALVQIETTAIV
jgi:predicted RNase H-like HicB family nuclease